MPSLRGPLFVAIHSNFHGARIPTNFFINGYNCVIKHFFHFRVLPIGLTLDTIADGDKKNKG